jgi:hypothetical protein
MIADLAAEVARRQQARFGRMELRPSGTFQSRPSSRWAHVPLAKLFAEQGNRIHERSDGRLEAGHEPFHSSKSGRCILINKTAGTWYCRSCRRGGDAAAFVRMLRGCTYAEAEVWLIAQYGPPLGQLRSRRRRLMFEVVLP